MSLRPRTRDCSILSSGYTNPQIGQWIHQGEGGSNKDPVGPQLVDYGAEAKGATLYTARGQRTMTPRHSIRVGSNRAHHTRVHKLVRSVTFHAHFTTKRPNITSIRDRSTGVAVGLWQCLGDRIDSCPYSAAGQDAEGPGSQGTSGHRASKRRSA